MPACDLIDVSSLSCLPALKELIIPQNRQLILETIPINLTQLEKLNVSDCNVSNLSHLTRFECLEELHLSDNRAIKLDTIPLGFRRKRKFNEATSPVAVSNVLTHLRKLFLTGCSLTDISALNRFPMVEECCLSWNSIIADSIPRNLIHLRSLSLEGCGLNDVSSLVRLPSLEEVDLRGNYRLDLQTIPRGLKYMYHTDSYLIKS